MAAPENIELQPLSDAGNTQSPSSNERVYPSKLKDLVRKLQEQEKVFPYSYSPEESILEMERLLEPIILVSLDAMYAIDIPLAELICHAFFHQSSHIESNKTGELHTMIKDPYQLYGLLIAAYISNRMWENGNEDEEFKSNHNYFEDAAIDMFNEIFKSNKEKLEYHFLAYDYERIFRTVEPGFPETEYESRELLYIAYEGKCMKFLSHSACQNYIQTRWKKRSVESLLELGNRSSLINTVNDTTATVTIETEADETHKRNRCYNFLPRISPEFKYFTHMVLDLLFIILLAVYIIRNPFSAEMSEIDIFFVPTIWFFIHMYIFSTLVLGLISYMCKLVVRMIHKHPKNRQRTVNGFHIVCLLIPFFVIPSFVILFERVELITPIYTIAFVISSLSLLQYISFFEYFGVKIELIKKMAISIVNYMVLLFFFWFIYAVCYLSLTETSATRNETIVWQLFEKGAFEIFGESSDKDREGLIDRCEEIFWNNFNYTNLREASCLYRSTLLPFLLLVYMFVAAVMLINVFTAMLSYEYEKLQEASRAYIKYHRYYMLIKFESTYILPAPFNAIMSVIAFCGLCCGIFKLKDLIIMTVPLTEGIHQIRYKINEEKIKKVARKVLEKRRIHNDIKLQLTEGLIKTFGEYLSTQSAEAQESGITSLREEIKRSTMTKTST